MNATSGLRSEITCSHTLAMSRDSFSDGRNIHGSSGWVRLRPLSEKSSDLEDDSVDAIAQYASILGFNNDPLLVNESGMRKMQLLPTVLRRLAIPGFKTADRLECTVNLPNVTEY